MRWRGRFPLARGSIVTCDIPLHEIRGTRLVPDDERAAAAWQASVRCQPEYPAEAVVGIRGFRAFRGEG